MPSTTSSRRKSKSTPFRASALEALRDSGLVGLFVGTPDLASHRKQILKEKLRGKAGAAR